VYHTLCFGRRDILACGRWGWGGPNSDEGTDTVVLWVYCISQRTYIPRVPQCLSPRPNWDPLSPASEKCFFPPKPKGGGVHTRLRVREWDGWRKSLVFCLLCGVYKNFVHKCVNMATISGFSLSVISIKVEIIGFCTMKKKYLEERSMTISVSGAYTRSYLKGVGYMYQLLPLLCIYPAYSYCNKFLHCIII
jgi:hypothetical protein